MCYSAKVRADYKAYVKEYGAQLTLPEYVREYWEQMGNEWIDHMPGAIRAWFKGPGSEEKARIASEIDRWSAQKVTEWETKLLEQQVRLDENLAKLAVKYTKTAENHVRIASNKIATIPATIEMFKRPGARADTARIFPQSIAPIIISENGKRTLKLMRFQCRPAGRPSSNDFVRDRVTKQKRMSGTYNARRDNLEQFWKGQFGYTHGVVLADCFYEHVWRHEAEGRELRPKEVKEDVILEFRPDNGQLLHIACLWSHWTGDGAGEPGEPDLESFAFITDDPPPEVAAAGHDRCIIPINPDSIDAWLNPDPANLAAMHAILDARDRPYYEHDLAAAA